jgi:hypothetical protein
MQLVELFIPLRRRDIAARELDRLAHLFSERFGGATLFVRSPGEGLWKDKDHIDRDDIAVLEVMTETVDPRWWRDLRQEIETALSEKEIMIRATRIDRL